MDPSSIPGILKGVPDVPDLTSTLPLPPSFSIFNYFNNLPFSLKVFACCCVMLIIHYAYNYIKHTFFSKKVSFEEDPELLNEVDNISVDDDMDNMDDEDIAEMESELTNTLNAE